MNRPYPEDWDSRRRAVYRRDGYTCQNCGRRGGSFGSAELHAHHIVPKSRGGTDRVSNLKTVCKECHDAIHGRGFAPTAALFQTGSEPDQIPIKVGKGFVTAFAALSIYFFVRFPNLETAFLMLVFLPLSWLIWMGVPEKIKPESDDGVLTKEEIDKQWEDADIGEE